MITKRTRLLQVRTDTGWQWVFCWSVQRSRVVTTAEYRKALRGDEGNLEYFKERAPSMEFRAFRPVDVDGEVAPGASPIAA